MYALQGMAVTYLADLFCSGIPLSTVNFGGDFTYKAGSTTADVYTQAIALFDTALSLAGDSVRVKHLAQVGRGRALLALARFQDAAEAVRTVPDTFVFRIPISLTTSLLGASVTLSGGVADREGTNGMPYRTSGDPRSRTQLVVGANTPVKYVVNTTNREAWLTIADGDEARLIEAEADLQNNGNQWLHTLNALRTNGTFTVGPTGDTLWKAGSGGYDGLRPLTDPALSPIPDGMDATTVRVNLLFAERAYWLFVTGRRQGDLRRLVRQYQRDSETVYPTGNYGPTRLARYGSDVSAPVPDNEFLYNRLYTGCVNRDA
jgi:hypothetical protein